MGMRGLVPRKYQLCDSRRGTMSTSAGTIRTIHARFSPMHSPFQSPPDSPSLSASGSSPVLRTNQYQPHPVEETLIIPSLTLPALLISSQATPGAAYSLARARPARCRHPLALFVDNPDALDPNAWHTDNDNDSSERWNIELVALWEDVHQLDIEAIEQRILAPFRSVAALLAPPLLSSAHEEELLTALLMGHEVPLYTATARRVPFQIRIYAPILEQRILISVQLSPTPSEMEVDIPETLRRLVPVIVLFPDPEPTPSVAHHRRDRSRSRSRSCSRSPTKADTDLDMYTDMDMDLGANDAADLNDTTVALPASAPGLALDVPPTARLPARPRHAARERTVTYPRPTTTTTADFTSTSTSWTPPHTHTPSTLRVALRPPALRVLRAAAAARFVRWWRAGGVDPYADAGRGRSPSCSPSPSARASPTTRRLRAGVPPPPRCAPPAPGESPAAAGRAPGGVSVSSSAARRAHTPPFAHVQQYAHADPLHLPSLLALVRDVVRAWAGRVWVGRAAEVEVGKGTVKGWRRGWAFVAGVLLGVGVWGVGGVDQFFDPRGFGQSKEEAEGKDRGGVVRRRARRAWWAGGFWSGRCGMWPPRTMRTALPARVGTARPAFVLFPQSSRVHREDIRTSTAACAEPFASLLSSSVSPSHSFSLTPRLHTVLIARAFGAT
ncbi:hypothetical protein B0H14DRAFT_3885133 [Mycena olivaceomarginata]|nr:hypothetical protein B0H14DRAFT_3885133 [Mycena olivaceomarginata]